jgi:hypothetical protein
MTVARVFGRDPKPQTASLPTFQKSHCINFGGVLTLAALKCEEPPGACCATTGGSLPPQPAPSIVRPFVDFSSLHGHN